LALVWLPESGRADQAGAAGAFLISLTDRAMADLADESIPVDERKVRFRHLFKDNFDIPAIGRFVLGRYWRAADDAAREEFLSVFEDVMVDRFAPQFSGYAGTKFQIGVIREVKEDDQLMVSSTVAPPNSEVVQVDWRLRNRDGGFKVLDVVAQGVSMALTLRSEYGSVLKNSGGKIDDLIALLRERTEKAG
jgi:phospholipid transport system substrate-binding protein